MAIDLIKKTELFYWQASKWIHQNCIEFAHVIYKSHENKETGTSDSVEPEYVLKTIELGPLHW